MSFRAWLALPALAPLLFTTSCLLNPIGEDPGFDDSDPTSAFTPASGNPLIPGSPSAGLPGPTVVSPSDDGEIVCGGPMGGPSPSASAPATPSDPSPITPPVATAPASQPTTAPTPTPVPTTTSTAVPDVPPVDDDPTDEMPSDGDAGPDAGARPAAVTAPVLPPTDDAGAAPAPQDAGREDRWRWRR